MVHEHRADLGVLRRRHAHFVREQLGVGSHLARAEVGHQHHGFRHSHPLEDARQREWLIGRQRDLIERRRVVRDEQSSISRLRPRELIPADVERDVAVPRPHRAEQDLGVSVVQRIGLGPHVVESFPELECEPGRRLEPLRRLEGEGGARDQLCAQATRKQRPDGRLGADRVRRIPPASFGVGIGDVEQNVVDGGDRCVDRDRVDLAREARLEATKDAVADRELQIRDAAVRGAIAQPVRPFARCADDPPDLAPRVRPLGNDHRVEKSELVEAIEVEIDEVTRQHRRRPLRPQRWQRDEEHRREERAETAKREDGHAQKLTAERATRNQCAASPRHAQTVDVIFAPACSNRPRSRSGSRARTTS